MNMADILARVNSFDEPLRTRLLSEISTNPDNGCVGQKLVVDDERARVWTIHLAPGARFPLHKHVTDYIWVALTGGRARSCVITADETRLDEFELVAGASKFNHYGPGEFKMHDLENIGDSELVFSVVEFGGGANGFLTVPDGVRSNSSDGVVASRRVA